MEDTDWAEQRLRVLFSFNKGRQTCHSIFLGNCEALNFYKKDNPLSILQEQKNGVSYTQPLFTRRLRGRRCGAEKGGSKWEIWLWNDVHVRQGDLSRLTVSRNSTNRRKVRHEEGGNRGSEYLHMFRVRWSEQDNNARGAFFARLIRHSSIGGVLAQRYKGLKQSIIHVDPHTRPGAKAGIDGWWGDCENDRLMAPGAGNRVPTPKVGYSLNGYSLKAAGLENNQFRKQKRCLFWK